MVNGGASKNEYVLNQFAECFEHAICLPLQRKHLTVNLTVKISIDEGMTRLPSQRLKG